MNKGNFLDMLRALSREEINTLIEQKGKKPKLIKVMHVYNKK